MCLNRAFFKVQTIFCLIIFGFIASVASAQSPEILGIVIDIDTGEPLPGVTIVSAGTGTTTGLDGRYRMQLQAGSHDVVFNFLGYTPYTKKITLAPTDALIVNSALKNKANELNLVVVTASKFEQKLSDVVVSMNVISPQFISQTNKLTLEDAMDQVPGVTVIDGQANIRGGSGFSYGAGSRVLVLVDDMPLLAADAGDVKWSFLPIESMAQAEVIKGASSALFGSSALNGVINLRTQYAKDKPATNVQMFAGIYDTPAPYKFGNTHSKSFVSAASFNHAQKFGQLDLVLGGQFFKDDGYRMAENEERVRGNINLRYRFKKVPGLQTAVRVNTQKANGGLFFIWANDTAGALQPLGGTDTATTTVSIYETKRTYFDNEWSYITKSSAVHKLKFRYYNTSNTNNTNQEAFGHVYFNEYQFQKKFKPWLTATAGLVNQYNKVTSQLYGNHTSNNTAVYAQADATYKRFNFSIGGRAEYNRIDTVNGKTTPVFRTGVNYKIAEGSNVRLSYGQGYRFPSIAEKFVSTEVSSIVIFPNDSLNSEKGWSAECGLQQAFIIGNFKAYADVALFVNRYTNMMEFTFGIYGPPAPPLFGAGFQSQNIGNTIIKGVDFTLAGQGNIGMLPLQLMAGYTYIEPTYTDFEPAVDTLYNSSTKNILKYRFQHMFKSDIQLTIKKVSIGFSTRYYSFMENIDKPFELLIPGVQHYRKNNNKGDWIADARLAYSIDKNVSVAAIAKNIFNHIYVSRPADVQAVRTFTLQVVLNY